MDINLPGVLAEDIATYDRNNFITAQKGNVIFDAKQPDALKSDADVRIFGYGEKQIKSLTNMGIRLSNIAITPTQVSTTTTGAVSNSTTIPVAEVGNISTLSSIRGTGIAAGGAAPTVALKSVASGAGNITASAAQTLLSGQTLFFDKASNVLTLTGDIHVSNMAIADTTLYFDLEKFIKIL